MHGMHGDRCSDFTFAVVQEGQADSRLQPAGFVFEGSDGTHTVWPVKEQGRKGLNTTRQTLKKECHENVLAVLMTFMSFMICRPNKIYVMLKRHSGLKYGSLVVFLFFTSSIAQRRA